jgi:hypothetical protein
VVCEGDTADAVETRIVITDPTTADRTFTIPNADSNAVQPLTCSGTDKVSAISPVGVITCSADQTGAGGGDAISVGGTAATDPNFLDTPGVDVVYTAAAPDTIEWNFRYDQTLAVSPALAASTVIFSDDCPGGGFLSEGSTANTNEQLYCFPSADGADTTSEITLNAATQTLTNKTLDAEATGNILTLPVKIEMVAAGCDGSSAASAFDLPTSNAPAKGCFGASPHRFGALDFADGSALTASARYLLPSDWTSSGGVDLKFVWFSGSTSTNSAVWTVQTVCVADGDDVLNPSYNSVQTVSDANNASASTRNSASITGITMTGCAAGETLFLKIGRDPTNGSDTLAATVSLQSIELTVRRQM